MQVVSDYFISFLKNQSFIRFVHGYLPYHGFCVYAEVLLLWSLLKLTPITPKTTKNENIAIY